MRELQQKQLLKQKIYSTPAIIILLVITVFFGRGVIMVLMKEKESAKRVLELEEKMATLSEREKILMADSARLKSEEGIDAEIKTRFSVAKAGEKVVVIVDPQTSNATSTEVKSKAWYSRLWEGFKNLW